MGSRRLSPVVAPAAPAAAAGSGWSPTAAHVRWNRWVIGVDGAAFLAMFALLSPYTVVPSFVRQLGAPPYVVGLVPFLQVAGFFVPQMPVARAVAGMARLKPLLLPVAILQRLGIAAMAGVASLSPSLGAACLPFFLAAFAAYSFAGGMLYPAWGAFVARAVPHGRGTLFAAFNVAGSLLSLLGGLAVTAVTERYPGPAGYSAVFLLALALSACSLVAVALFREEDEPLRGEAGGGLLHQVGAILREDARYRAFLAARSVMALGEMGAALYTLAGTERFGLPGSAVGVFTTALVAGQTVAYFVWGKVGDRFGFHRIYLVAAPIGCAMAMLAAFAGSPGGYVGVFPLLGAVDSAYRLGDVNVSIQFAAPGRASLYIAITNTVVQPLMALAPLAGGGVAALAGYEAAFTGAALFYGAAATLFATQVLGRNRTGGGG